MSPAEELRELLPARFTDYVAELRRTAQDDPQSEAALKALLDLEVCAKLKLADERLSLTLRGGELLLDRCDAPCLMALGVPDPIVKLLLAQVRAANGVEALLVPWGQLTPEKVAILLASEVRAHIVLSSPPPLGELRIQLGIGCEEPPQTPEFEVYLELDGLEAMSEGRLSIQEAMMAGHLRLEGDYGPALQLFLQLAQA